MENLEELAKLLSKRNSIDEEIGAIIGRPALTGHVGEYIASQVFNIELSDSASEKSIDGYFRSGNLVGRSVNIKYYTVKGSILDITPERAQADWYFVSTVATRSAEQRFIRGFYTSAGSNHLIEATRPIASRLDEPLLAP